MKLYRILFYLICTLSVTFNQGLIERSSVSGNDFISRKTQIVDKIERTLSVLKRQVLHDYAIHYLIPFTKKEDLMPCEKAFDASRNFNEALSCSNSTVFSSSPLKDVNPPQCYVITGNSPDVMESEDGSFNYISTSILLVERILGFYEEEDQTIYLVETYDMEQVYRHELQHYFLHLKEGDGNGAHDHAIWQSCEPPTYTPSKAAVLHGRKKALKK